MIGQLEGLLDELDQLRVRAIAELEPITSSATLDEWDIRYLGRNRGELKNFSAIMPKLSKEERPVVGQKINQVKAELEKSLAARRQAVQEKELQEALERERIDVTMPGRHHPYGHI